MISSDTVWTKIESPYEFSGPVDVKAGVTLTIEAGTVVNLNGHYLQIDGTLLAKGSTDDKIYFYSGSIKFTDSSIDWNEQTGTGCVLENTIFEAKDFVANDLATIHVENASPKIDNNILGKSASHYVIEVWGGSPPITRNMINGPVGLLYAGSARSNSYVAGNIIAGGSEGVEISCMGAPIIERNSIMSTNGMGVYLLASFGDSTPTIRNNTIANNNYGISILYDSADPFEPVITFNNFQDNTGYNIYCDPSLPSSDTFTINAPNNWWGTTNEEAISQSIYDYQDNFNLGTITFTPFLTEPNPETQPSSTTLITPTATPSMAPLQSDSIPTEITPTLTPSATEPTVLEAPSFTEPTFLGLPTLIWIVAVAAITILIGSLVGAITWITKKQR